MKKTKKGHGIDFPEDVESTPCLYKTQSYVFPRGHSLASPHGAVRYLATLPAHANLSMFGRSEK